MIDAQFYIIMTSYAIIMLFAITQIVKLNKPVKTTSKRKRNKHIKLNN